MNMKDLNKISSMHIKPPKPDEALAVAAQTSEGSAVT
jgi:hypothetical protein